MDQLKKYRKLINSVSDYFCCGNCKFGNHGICENTKSKYFQFPIQPAYCCGEDYREDDFTLKDRIHQLEIAFNEKL